ncbi:MAG: hypothetical protein D3918_16610, partial [Candidatus Electrothrix sp. AX2]|nr:hypothetical protein [Candidatus Electrothrix gigas]
MDKMDKFLRVHNGERVNRSALPHLSFHEFRNELLAFTVAGGQVVQFFAYRDNKDNRDNRDNKDSSSLKLLAVLRNDKLYVTGCDAP